MAILKPIDEAPTAVPTHVEHRTPMIVITARRGHPAEYEVTVHREATPVDADGVAVGDTKPAMRPITRKVGWFAGKAVDVNGVAVPAELLIAALPKFADLVAEDEEHRLAGTGPYAEPAKE